MCQLWNDDLVLVLGLGSEHCHLWFLEIVLRLNHTTVKSHSFAHLILEKTYLCADARSGFQ
jgi:hypothetical protein